MAKQGKHISGDVAPKVVKKRNGVTLSAIAFNVAGKRAVGFIEKFYIGRNGTAMVGLN
jgi:hypothetical protein